MSVFFRQLRQHIRSQRKALSIFQHRQAEQAVLRYMYRHAKLKSAHKVGIYLDDFGEVYTQKLIEYLLSHSKQVYLPQVCAMNQQLTWVNVSLNQYRNQRFVRHRLKMLEAKASRGQMVNQLDVIFMPLLACDSIGMRVGMGGGFYDRTLAQSYKNVYRIGLAHDFQYLNQQKIPAQDWDEPLDELWTPKQKYRFKRI